MKDGGVPTWEFWYFLKWWDIKFEDLIGDNFSKLKKKGNTRPQIQSVLTRNE